MPREKIVEQWDDHYHYVDFRADDLSVKHPMTESLTGSLMTCRINVDAEDWKYGSRSCHRRRPASYRPIQGLA